MKSLEPPCHTLLIVPPVRTLSSRVFPVGIGYIAAVLKENNYNVRVIDYTEHIKFDEKQAVEEILRINPAFIGFIVNSISYLSAKSLIASLKVRSPKVKVVVGGPHASALPKESLEDLRCDFVVVGEGERVLLEIIKRVEARNDHFEDLKGLAFWNNNTAVLNPGINIIEDLDNLPFPVRGPFSNTKHDDVCGDIFSRRAPVATLLTSRGCPHQCTFCGSRLVHGRGFRARSAKNVVDEIEFLVKERNYKEITIVDDTFSEIRPHAVGICAEIIRRKIDIVWRVAVGMRADTLDRDLLRIFKASGCYKIGIGIESFSAAVLKDIKKPLSRAQLQEKISLIKSFGIETLGYFILGLPKDTEESIMETIRFARDSGLDFPYFSHAVPLPGTEFFEQKYKGKNIRDIDWDDFSTLKNRSCGLSAVPPEKLKRFFVFAYLFSYLKFQRLVRIFMIISRSQRIKFLKIFRYLFGILKNAC